MFLVKRNEFSDYFKTEELRVSKFGENIWE